MEVLKNTFLIIVLLSIFNLNLCRTDEENENQNSISVAVAWFDCLQLVDQAFESRDEFRSFYKMGIFNTFIGLMATSDGASATFTGLMTDIYLSDFIIFTPSFAAGLFSCGSGKFLDHEIEFRSQIELTYKFIDGTRIGVSFNHISNANLGEVNPGVESLALSYCFPL